MSLTGWIASARTDLAALRAGRHADALWTLFVLGVLPNVLLGVGAAHGSRPVVNLDYFAVAALDRKVSRGLSALLLFVALVLDMAFSFAPVFNFGPTEVVAAVEEIVHFRGRTLVAAITVVSAIVFVAVVLVRVRGRPPADGGDTQRRAVAMCGVVALLVLAVDVANGSNIVGRRAHPALPVADAGGSVLVGAMMSAARTSSVAEYGGRMPAATDEIRAALSDSGSVVPQRIVLVMIESMGLPVGGDERELLAPLFDTSVTQRYDVATGVVPFLGATVAGELRELCGRRLSLTSVHEPRGDCLPPQLKSLGYETVAFHGYHENVFSRRTWYPRVGFDRMIFKEDLDGRQLAQCGVLFRGVCDSSMVDLLRSELLREPDRKRFVYWLTLTSHFPLDPRSPRSPDVCATIGDVGKDPDVCAQWTALWPALQGVARLASDTSVPPAWYIVVGDHSPRLLVADDNLYSRDRVPYAVLKPKT